MTKKKYVMALDEGTTSCRAILFDYNGQIVNMAQKEFTQYYPKPGWVEHDAMEIWGIQSGVMREVIETSAVSTDEVAAIGITNQRETAVVWDKETGKPIHNALVWQSRQTAAICEDLLAKGYGDYIRANTGLVVDAYFSATKVRWILDQVPGAQERAERGELLFGTIDTWLIWNLTRGEAFVTDYSNASRTMMYNIRTLEWDKQILEWLNIPEVMLPEVRNSSEIYGHTHEKTFGGAKIPISGAAGDQQAALFGQACFLEGMVKNTYGTGAFILMNTGKEAIQSESGLLTTIAWGLKDQVTYALEGSVFSAGASIQWLRDEMRLIYSADESEYFASKEKDANGVYVVPAFAGLGTPYWDMYARGTIVGLTRGANRNHIIRATLEAIAYRSRDVIDKMEEESKIKLKELKVDGGASRNKFLLQFQSDILDVPVARPKIVETTALGAAFLAGLAVGFWQDQSVIIEDEQIAQTYKPKMTREERDRLYTGWKKAVSRALAWEED